MKHLFCALAFFSGLVACQAVHAVPVTDGMVLWLDATDSATLFKDDDMNTPATPGDEVLVWADKSGSDNHAIADFFLPPVYESGAMNGQDAVRFDGLDQSGMIISDDLFVDRPYTAFIVNQYWGDIRGRTLQARDGPNWLHGLWAGNFGSYADGWIHNQAAEIDFVYVEDTTGDLDGSTFFANGVDFSRNTTPLGEPGFLAFASAGQFAAEVSDADVSEVVIYDRILTDTELGQVRDHLMEKYGAEEIPPPPEQNVVLAGTLGQFTSATDNVDFEGDFAYAINIGGLDGFVVGDAEFSDGTLLDCCQDGADVFTEDRQIDPWYTGGNFDDADLEAVMSSIRWSAAPAGIDVELDVEAGSSYKLQLLFGEGCCDRGFDIIVEGETVVEDFNANLIQGGANAPAGAVYSLDVTAGDNKLNIELIGPNESAPDNNPILNAVTLEVGGAGLLGDFNGNGMLDAEDIDLLSKDVVAGNNTPRFDLNGDGNVNEADRVMWVESPEVSNTYFGDANLDGEFNSSDFVVVFTAGKYEDGVPMNASWADGDWNGDMDFDSSDFVTAFVGGGYDLPPKAAAAAAVPEPSAIVLTLLGLIGIWARRRR